MSFPLAVIGGFLLWFFMTFVKWRIMKSREQKFRKQSDQLYELLKKSSASTGKSPDDVLEEFYKKIGAEEDEKAKKCGKWKTIFEELEDRQRKDKAKGGKSKPTKKYSPEMFQDSFYKEGLESYQKLVKQQQLEADDKIQQEAENKKKSRNTKTKRFINGLKPKYL